MADQDLRAVIKKAIRDLDSESRSSRMDPDKKPSRSEMAGALARLLDINLLLLDRIEKLERKVG